MLSGIQTEKNRSVGMSKAQIGPSARSLLHHEIAEHKGVFLYSLVLIAILNLVDRS